LNTIRLHPPHRSGLRAGVATALVAALAAAPVAALATPQPIATGVTLHRINLPGGPQRIRVLRIGPSALWRLSVATAGPVGVYARPSTMGGRAHALAAVNGGFALFPGLPTHLVEAGGALRTTGLDPGPVFALAADGTPAIGMAKLRIVALDKKGHRHVRIASWNRPAKTRPGTVNGYTPAGGHEALPPSGSCAVRLEGSGVATWTSNGALDRTYTVSDSACGTAPMAVEGRTVLAAASSSAEGAWLKSLVVSDTLTIRTSYAWPGVLDAVGGQSLLVDGKAQVPTGCTTWICIRQPRTGVGITASGGVLLVTVDGRIKGAAGMTLRGFALYLRSLGAVTALDLDGGGGTAMWTKANGLVNHPSDPTGERPVTSAVLVRTTPDAPALRSHFVGGAG
jgi:Phosphodiester glycosidase